MWLVEVLQTRDDIGDWDAGGQEHRGLACALDLPYGALSEAGRCSVPAFDGASRDRWTVASADLGDERVTDHGSGADETVDQGLNVVGAGRLPADAVQPNGPARCVGQFDASVDQGLDGHSPERRAHGELDAEEGRALRNRRGAGPGHGAGNACVRPALTLPEH